MANKVCTECKTENESEFIYCKNCGSSLKDSDKTAESSNSTEFIGSENTQSNSQNEFNYAENNRNFNSFNNNENFRNFQSNTQFNGYSVNGIPAEDVSIFVGKKADLYIPKFIKMELANTKISWCWPAAILGLLIGPLGAALWFIYRKMYKIAGILLAIGFVVSCATSALTYNSNQDIVNNLLDALKTGEINIFINGINQFLDNGGIRYVISNGIENITSLATCIITGLLGHYAYRNHCVKKIISFRQSGIDQRYYKMGLAAVGGVSGGMLAAGIFSIAIINSIISYGLLVFSLL